MEEAADADHIVIIDKGQIVANGTPLELKNQYTGDFVSVYGINEEEAKKLSGKYEKIRDGYRFFVKDTTEATELIIKNPELFKDYEIIKGKMDDVFLSATGKKLSGGDEE
jgi:multidrug/hemolysin transport system ATP-binding protein